MPMLRGSMDLWGDRPEEPCRWCGGLTATLLAPPGSELGPIPLHAVCGAEIIVLFQDLQVGRLPSADDQIRLARLAEP